MGRYFIEIEGTQARIHHGDADKAEVRDDLHLSPDDMLSIKGERVRLGDLLGALIHYDTEWLEEYFDERGQYDTGTYLYRQIFGDTPPDELAGDSNSVEVRIISADENISRLPWMLLAHHGVFLSTVGWSVALASHAKLSDQELPPSPKILVIAPQPGDWSETEELNPLQERILLLLGVPSEIYKLSFEREITEKCGLNAYGQT